MIISMIVAMDERGGIGLYNRVPWHIPADLKRFKALTMGHHLIMGRKTYESIGRLLPGRIMIVLSRSKKFKAEGCLVLTSLQEVLSLARERGESEVFIAGGGMIYAQAMPLAERIYLTRVQSPVEADVYFPPWDMAGWQIVYQEDGVQAVGDVPAYRFYVYERVN